ncbi:unnamed protein product [Trichogramma brassicae]|uniref:Uncharacterized protein n=1 Tax=Trichogramma brassicae TaxID=86971 RepID=A0A6H5HXB3_9HYME|nr:unnamed protein product [Trichogramma brassicae]
MKKAVDSHKMYETSRLCARARSNKHVPWICFASSARSNTNTPPSTSRAIRATRRVKFHVRRYFLCTTTTGARPLIGSNTNLRLRLGIV